MQMNMQEIILDMQAKAHDLHDRLWELLGVINEEDPQEENEELQEMRSRLLNVEVELEYLKDEIDVPGGAK